MTRPTVSGSWKSIPASTRAAGALNRRSSEAFADKAGRLDLESRRSCGRAGERLCGTHASMPNREYCASLSLPYGLATTTTGAQGTTVHLDEVHAESHRNVAAYTPHVGRNKTGDVLFEWPTKSSSRYADTGSGFRLPTWSHLRAGFTGRPRQGHAKRRTDLGFVARHIVDAHGGRSVWESAVGRFTVFRLRRVIDWLYDS